MLERNRGIKDTQYPWLAWGREMLMQHHRYAHKYKGITFRQGNSNGTGMTTKVNVNNSSKYAHIVPDPAHSEPLFAFPLVPDFSTASGDITFYTTLKYFV